MPNFKDLLTESGLSEATIKVLEESFDAAVEEGIEAQVQTTIEETVKLLEEKNVEYQKFLDEKTQADTDQYINETLIPDIERYKVEALKEFTEKHQTGVDALKLSIAESLIGTLVESTSAYSVQIKEGQFEKLTLAEAENVRLKTRLDKALDDQKALTESMQDMKAKAIKDRLSESLSSLQKEKLKTPLDEVKFINEAQYEDAIKETIKNYAPSAKLHESQNREHPENKPETESRSRFQII